LGIIILERESVEIVIKFAKERGLISHSNTFGEITAAVFCQCKYYFDPFKNLK